MTEFLSGNRFIAYPLAFRPQSDGEEGESGSGSYDWFDASRLILDASVGWSRHADRIVVSELTSDGDGNGVITLKALDGSVAEDLRIEFSRGAGEFVRAFGRSESGDFVAMLVLDGSVVDEFLSEAREVSGINVPFCVRCISCGHPMVESIELVSRGTGDGEVPDFDPSSEEE